MSFASLRRYPLLLPVAGFALGLLAGARWGGLASLAPGLALACGLGLAILSRPSRAPGLALLAFGLGWLRVGAALPPEERPPWRAWLESSAKIEARWRVEAYPACVRGLCRFPARLLGYREGETFHPLELGLAVKGRGERFLIPDQVYRSTLRLRRPRGFRNPHSFDYPRYLRLGGVSATAFVEDLSAAKLERDAVLPLRLAGALRLRLRERIREAVPEGPARGVLAALLLGEEGLLDPEVEEDFRRAGLTHVLVVSGLHFGLVLLFFYGPIYLLLALRRPWAEGGGARRAALGLALPPAFGYGLVVGLTPSVWRGLGFCAAIFLAALWRGRRDFTATLLLVAGLLLLLHPLWIFSLSFQLSFLSVASLAYFGRVFAAWWESAAALRPWMRGKWAQWVATSLFASLVANLALLPLLGSAFHEVSLIAPAANLVLVPFFASFLLPAELLAGLADLLHPPWASLIFAKLGAWLGPVLKGLAVPSRWRHATAWVGPWSLSHWGAYLFSLAALASLGRRRRAALFAGVAGLAGVAAWAGVGAEVRPPRLALAMLDVGQGESLLLRLPEGQGLVIDGGGFPYSDFDVGGKVVIPELLGRGLRRPSALVLTHLDADHWKGLKSLATRLEVGEFWVGAGSLEDPGFAALSELLAARGIPLRILSQGRRWAMGGAEFEVLWPPGESARRRGLSDNDRSLALRVCRREVCFLLTGDLEAEGEAAVAAALAGRDVQVLKVAHHGSATSTGVDFMKGLRPHWALISAGEGNRYRLPHAAVLRRLTESGARLLRTDKMGQVEVETDGKEVFVRAFIDGPSPSRWSAIRAAAFESGS